MLSSLLKNTKLCIMAFVIVLFSIFIPSCSTSSNNSSNTVYKKELSSLKSISNGLYESYLESRGISLANDPLKKRVSSISSLFSFDTLIPAVSIIKVRLYALFFSIFSILLYLTNFIAGVLFGRYLHNKAISEFIFMPKLRLSLMALGLFSLSICTYLTCQTSFASIVYLMLLAPLIPFLFGARLGLLFFNICTK